MESVAEDVAYRVQVAGDLRRELARLAPLAEGKGQALQVCVDRGAQVVHDEVAGAPQPFGDKGGCERIEQRDRDGERGYDDEQLPIPVVDLELPPAVLTEQAVDDELQGERTRQLGDHDHRDRAERGHERLPVPPGGGPDEVCGPRRPRAERPAFHRPLRGARVRPRGPRHRASREAMDGFVER